MLQSADTAAAVHPAATADVTLPAAAEAASTTTTAVAAAASDSQTPKDPAQLPYRVRAPQPHSRMPLDLYAWTLTIDVLAFIWAALFYQCKAWMASGGEDNPVCM
jgi:hypothetical protein